MSLTSKIRELKTRKLLLTLLFLLFPLVVFGWGIIILVLIFPLVFGIGTYLYWKYILKPVLIVFERKIYGTNIF